jgi:hypothetical protein
MMQCIDGQLGILLGAVLTIAGEQSFVETVANL